MTLSLIEAVLPPVKAAIVDVGLAAFMFGLSSKRLPVFVRVITPAIAVTLFAPALMFDAAFAAVAETHFLDHKEAEPRWAIINHLISLIGGIALTIVAFGLVYSVTGLKRSNPEGDPIDSRLDCVYYSAVVWSTIGFGDIVPSRGLSKLITAYEALLAYFMLAVTVSEFSPLAAALVRLGIGTPM